MRYFLVPVALLTDRESQSAIPSLLVGAYRLRPFLSTGSAAAPWAAVSVSAVAATAQEEDLSAAIAADEAEGVHGPQRPAGNWTWRFPRATNRSSATGSSARPEGSELVTPGPRFLRGSLRSYTVAATSASLSLLISADGEKFKKSRLSVSINKE